MHFRWRAHRSEALPEAAGNGYVDIEKVGVPRRARCIEKRLRPIINASRQCSQVVARGEGLIREGWPAVGGLRRSKM